MVSALRLRRSNPSLSASSGKIARLAFCESFFVKRSSVNKFTSGRLSNKSKSRLCRYSCYFSACKLRSKGKDERSDVNPSLGFQVPPVAAIDTFLHHRSGCKKASTYGKMNLPSVAAVLKTVELQGPLRRAEGRGVKRSSRRLRSSHPPPLSP